MTPIQLARLFALALAFAWGLFAAPAFGAGMPAPRPHVVVEAPQLRLSDLFDNAGAAGLRVIAAAPAPGQRYLIEARDLARIARAHGLAWRPHSPAEQSIVERPGIPIPRTAFEDALRAALAGFGAEAEDEVEFAAPAATFAPVGAAPRIMATEPALDPASRRFVATLLVSAEGMPAIRQRISGRLHATIMVPAAAHRLSMGHVVGTADLRPVRIRAARMEAGLVTDPQAVIGLALRRPLAAGALFVERDLRRPVLVPRGGPVTMILQSEHLSIAAAGRALEDGGIGDRIRVANSTSRTEVEAVVIGPGRVRVAMPAADGAPSLPPTPRSAMRAGTLRQAEATR
ncbi:MAG: flagellar basal body P-ring formation protein FlgA [Alphaproteobacteria bacterium]|nr:flagellar basal body P-ring formation protein FlgA [Alphaproteobacteria bacterium]